MSINYFYLFERESLWKQYIMFLTDSTEQVGIFLPSAVSLSQGPLRKPLVQQQANEQLWTLINNCMRRNELFFTVFWWEIHSVASEYQALSHNNFSIFPESFQLSNIFFCLLCKIGIQQLCLHFNRYLTFRPREETKEPIRRYFLFCIRID